jgi:GNAT superfamily N-acetyltransferase
MRIERFDPVHDQVRVRACHELFAIAMAADDPDEPPMSARRFAGWLAAGSRGDPQETWLISGAAGVDGWYLIEFPDDDGEHLGRLELQVGPGRRRRGLGTALARHAAGRALARGRTQLTAFARQDSAGEAFALALGAAPGRVIVRGKLDIGTMPAGHLEQLRATVRAAGYSVLSWQAPASSERMSQIAAMYDVLAGLPPRTAREASPLGARRARGIEGRLKAQRLRHYSVAACHDGSGELAGLTQLAVDPGQPEWAFQEMTVVLRAHRGHRLGLLIRIAMLQRLADVEPQLSGIVTGNADTSRNIIAINKALGYERLGPPARSWELALGADPPASL